MPIRIAFWNINTGTGSSDDRVLTFQAWCQAEAPDLLLLEEVSHTLENNLPGLTGLTRISHVNTRTKKLKPGTKQIWALQSANAIATWNFQATVLSLPGLVGPRSLLKVTMKIKNLAYQDFALWVLHAKATQRGGREAVEAAQSYLAKNAGAVIGGDFNYSIGNAGLEAVAPLSWQVGINLNFTQWNKGNSTTRGPNARLHLVTPPPIQPVMYRSIEPHNVIDYVMLGRNRGAIPLANCANEAIWIDILKNFDHCPVLYNLL